MSSKGILPGTVVGLPPRQLMLQKTGDRDLRPSTKTQASTVTEGVSCLLQPHVSPWLKTALLLKWLCGRWG